MRFIGVVSRDLIYSQQDYKTHSFFPTTSDVNDFIPIHALTMGTTLKVENKRTMVYDFRFNRDYIDTIKRMTSFAEYLAFSNYHNGRWAILKGRDINEEYIATPGMLLHIPSELTYELKFNILCLMTVRKSHMSKLDKNNIDKSAFCLLVNRSLIKDELHEKIYRNIKKYYIDEVSQDGIDIMFTDDIVKLCFNSTDLIEAPKVKTLTELNTHMESVKLNTLKFFFGEQYGEPIKRKINQEEFDDFIQEFSTYHRRTRRDRVEAAVEATALTVSESPPTGMPEEDLADIDQWEDDSAEDEEIQTHEPTTGDTDLPDLPF